MGMMGGPDDASGQGMMGMMDQGMMRMMMSHMMGGPGGMGKMMGQMGSGMKGPGGGPRGMAHMARMLESLNLTPGQWDQVRGLARERLEKMANLWAQRMKLQIELAGLSPIRIDGRKGISTGINSTVPGPLVHLREGDDVILNVTNRLMDTE